MSSFQGVGIEEFHCIQRCASFQEVGLEGNMTHRNVYTMARYVVFPLSFSISLLNFLASPEDPNAPHPVGPTMQPAVGVPLESRQDWHRNLEAAILHHSTTLAKQPAISVVEHNGKVQVQANYSKSE